MSRCAFAQIVWRRTRDLSEVPNVCSVRATLIYAAPRSGSFPPFTPIPIDPVWGFFCQIPGLPRSPISGFAPILPLIHSFL